MTKSNFGDRTETTKTRILTLNQKIDMKDFKFNKEEHYYELDGRRLYGVTTILGVIAKPALIPWAVKMATDYIENNAKSLRSFLTELEFSPKIEITNIEKIDADILVVNSEILKEAKSAHRKKKEAAGEKGTDAHSQIEDYIKHCIDHRDGIATDKMGTNEQVNHFVNWATKNNIQFLASEKQLYSETAWVAGTTDMVFIKDGKKYVGDVKTSSAIYPEHFYQMAAYRMMLEEMGETDFAGSVVIRIGKDGKFNESKDVQWRYDYQTDLGAFMGALAIFKATESYKVK